MKGRYINAPLYFTLLYFFYIEHDLQLDGSGRGNRCLFVTHTHAVTMRATVSCLVLQEILFFLFECALYPVVYVGIFHGTVFPAIY